MYKIFVTCLRLRSISIHYPMKKVILVLLCVVCNSCSNDANINTCFSNISVSETIDLNLPQFINLRVPGGWSYANGGHQGIVVFNLNGSQFKAFDRRCPEESPSNCSQMTVENSIKLDCACNNHQYNILNGSPLTSEGTCFAKEYFVDNINGTVLRISNF